MNEILGFIQCSERNYEENDIEEEVEMAQDRR